MPFCRVSIESSHPKWASKDLKGHNILHNQPYIPHTMILNDQIWHVKQVIVAGETAACLYIAWTKKPSLFWGSPGILDGFPRSFLQAAPLWSGIHGQSRLKGKGKVSSTASFQYAQSHTLHCPTKSWTHLGQQCGMTSDLIQAHTMHTYAQFLANSNIQHPSLWYMFAKLQPSNIRVNELQQIPKRHSAPGFAFHSSLRTSLGQTSWKLNLVKDHNSTHNQPAIQHTHTSAHYFLQETHIPRMNKSPWAWSNGDHEMILSVLNPIVPMKLARLLRNIPRNPHSHVEESSGWQLTAQ